MRDNVRVVCSRETAYGKVMLVLTTVWYEYQMTVHRHIGVKLHNGEYKELCGDTKKWTSKPTRRDIQNIHTFFRSLAEA